MRVNKSILVAGLVMVLGSAALAAPYTITSTVPQSGFVGLQNAPSYPLTGTPYDFTGQGANTLTTIDSITVTLSVNDGDSDLGDYDFNNLFLTLDGINTGLALNGFTNAQIVTLTLNQLAPGTAAAILAALADNQLVGGVLDISPGNSVPPGDTIGFPGLIDTTLEITGESPLGGGGGNQIPLPAAVLLAPLGAGLAGIYARRFRK